MKNFNKIFLNSKTISEKKQKGYKIYTDKNNFQIIEAETAAEAIEKSGLKSVYKIEKIGVVNKSIFTKPELSEA
jgi:hypothetical protein